MRSFYKTFAMTTLVLLLVSVALAQRPRVATSDTTTAKADTTKVATTSTLPAPQSVKAKYEGGVFGYNKKQDGTLSFDDLNNRLIFRDKTGKEGVSIPYAAVASAYGDTQSRRPAAATVMSSVPLPYGANLIGLFIKKKYQYLTLQYSDPDTKVAGITSFKVENKEVLASVLQTLANKAGMTQRGEIYVQKKEDKQSEKTN
ncbi:MAG: hypothetical protein WBP93_16835 [Pyrinomonadaceae bacterium]